MVPTEELKHDFFDNLMGVPQVLPGIKNGNYTRKTVLFWHLLPRFTSFYPLRHVSLTNCLTTPLSDSLLLQAFQKGGLQKLTKVDTFRGGVGGSKGNVECRVSSERPRPEAVRPACRRRAPRTGATGRESARPGGTAVRTVIAAQLSKSNAGLRDLPKPTKTGRAVSSL